MVLWLGMGPWAILGAGEIDFNRDIRPILSENCFHCHGPDKETREADFRLDVEEAAKADLGGYHGLVPGDADASEVYYRMILDADDGDLMPPKKSNRRLTAAQKKLIKQWIEEGAEYAEHWAYVEPERPEVAGVPRGGNEVDGFVRARLKEVGLKPSSEADARTLIRRVSLDLTGIPPTPEEVEAFLADESPRAYEKVVDRLLKSERFGERWARPWLDLARYADSNGFQADQLRDSWAYRDWVIDALNADMPFDQFTIEQLAGDLLPNATVDQKIATGFHRTVTCNVEAGVHPEENRVNQVVDRVNTTGTVWLGATLECAQCHDHKYDPFTMEDYYGMYAYFNNTPLEVENPGGKGVQFSFYGPKMELPMGEADKKKREEVETLLISLRAERDELMGSEVDGRDAWEERMRAALANPPEWTVLDVASFESNGGEDFRILKDQSVLVTGRVPGSVVYTITAETSLEGINGFRVEALTHPEIPGDGPGRGDAKRANFILSEIGVEVREKGERKARSIPLHSATADFSQVKWEVEKAIDGDPKTGWAIGPQFGKPHWAVFETAEAVGSSEGATFTFTLDQNYGRGRTIGRPRISALVGEGAILSMPEDVAEALKLEEKKRNNKQRRAIDAYYAESNPKVKKVDAQIAAAERRLKEVAAPTTLVMVEMEEPRETQIMKRGNYLDLGDAVDAATPAVLPPIDPSLPKNRLGLAKWLVSPENPLVARVTVNRWWAEIFGEGIVSTVEDFGTQSEPPSHPGLLDWLAVEFVESGWSMKHILKRMVMSATYRQDAALTPDLLEEDAGNRYLARGPRFRMSAEMIRDNALAVSGLLSTKMRGEPIMPYQPPGMWRQVGRNEPKWVDAEDEDRFRRGIYVIWRRAAPYPSFVNFDGPDRGSCVVKRPRTNTPLQALTLMNDPAYVEMAFGLASRLIVERPDASVGERLSWAYELVFSRRPSEGEGQYLESIYRERLGYYEANPEVAEQVIAGASEVVKPPAGVAAPQLAAWLHLSSILLNLDETITKG
ncbi:MAG: PSD1 and planctomycete cytochrome C domain-containing protein [Verrucomicrobiota bacterium]